MANPYLTNLADLRQLEARLDQRLELLARAEGNLKGLFEALRQQVASAYPVLEQLKNILPEARQQADDSRLTAAADRIADAMTERLYESIEQARAELNDLAGPIRRQLIGDLQAATDAAKASIAATEPPMPVSTPVSSPAPMPGQTAAINDIQDLAEAFRAEARLALDAVRESMLDRIDLLKSDAQLQIDPILNQINGVRTAAESQLCAVIEAQQASMQYRVEQLSVGIEEIASVLEERLTQRVAGMNRRAEDAVASIEPLLIARVNRVITQCDANLSDGEQKLQTRIDSIQPRLDDQLAEMDQHLAHRMRRMEDHASSMCSYLETKLISHVDELIQRLRLKLQQELSATTGAASPRSRHEPVQTPNRPSLELDLYINKSAKPTAA